MTHHIDDERLMELALTEPAGLSEEEASHLEACSECSGFLAEERALTAAIERMPQISVPAGFAQRAASMFAKATARRVAISPLLIAAVVAVAAITSSMLWLIIMNPSVFVVQAAIGAAKIAAFFRAMVLVMNRVPYAGEIMTTFSGSIVLISAGLMANLLKRAEQVK